MRRFKKLGERLCLYKLGCWQIPGASWLKYLDDFSSPNSPFLPQTALEATVANIHLDEIWRLCLMEETK